MTRFLRPALTVVTGASVLAAAACASRGPIPEIAALGPYSGEWSLEAAQPTGPGVQFVSRQGSGFVRGIAHTLGPFLGIRVERFVLEVSGSFFRMSSDEPGFTFSLPIDGTPVEVLAEDGVVEQSIALRWDDDMPVVLRTLPGVGWVSDRFELIGDEALVVTRTAAMTNNRGAEVRGTGEVEIFYGRGSGP